jgi:hypothetical protein
MKSSETCRTSFMFSVFMAASIAPAIFANRPSPGNEMILRRSLSTKNLRFVLRGGESVSIAIHCGTIPESLAPRKRSISVLQQAKGLAWPAKMPDLCGGMNK